MNSWSFLSLGSFHLLVGGQMNSFSAGASESLLLSMHVQAGWVDSKHSRYSILLMPLIYSL
ncbi:MAG: hypothetical protein QNL62_06630 [Gammaproteobacteria bacterium]|nr:hypothetical protein [Gammaproteobacteria bacterium]